MAWTFEGTLLPDGTDGHASAGSGPAYGLPGRFALVGLVDSHCHLTVSQGDGAPYLDPAAAPSRLHSLAVAGVTVVRDLGGDRSVTLRLGQVEQPGVPQVLAAGRFLAPAGRYIPGLYEPVAAADLLAAVEQEITDGASWVKIIGDFPLLVGSEIGPAAAGYASEVVAAAVRTAHALGVRVAAHTTTDTVSTLVQAGIDSVEHGDELTHADLAGLGARRGAWTPTLGAAFASPRASAQDKRALAERMANLLPHAVREGVTVLTGSDVTGSVATEVAWLHRLGLSVEQALAAAGPAAADFLAVERVGDLVTYDRDPRVDPEVLTTPAAVVVRGTRIR